MNEKIKEITNKFLTKKEIIKHVLESYNLFVKKNINFIIKDLEKFQLGEFLEGDVKVKYFLKISNPVFSKPELKEYNGYLNYIQPIDAIIRNLSYTSKLTLQITVFKELQNTEPEILHKRALYEICDFPVMVGSYLDPYPLEEWDLGGYFVVKGAERILFCIEEIGKNFIFYSNEDNSITVNIYSSTENYRFLHKLLYLKTKIVLTFQPINIKLNVLAIIRFLGITYDEIIEQVAGANMFLKLLLLSFFESENLVTYENCEKYLIKNLCINEEDYETQLNRINGVFDKYLLIHLGDDVDARKYKALKLLEMVKELLHLNITDKTNTKILDSYEYKRIKTPGFLLEDLFKQNLNKLFYNFREQFLKVPNKSKIKIFTLIKPDFLTNSILTAISTGNWIGGRQKITAILDRTNALSAISNLRRIISPLLKTQQHIEARIIDPTHRGRIDPLDTSHGLTCGLVKGLCMGAKISQFINEAELTLFLKNKFQKQIYKGDGILTLNQKIILTNINLDKIISNLKEFRLIKTISQDISLNYNNFSKKILNLNTEYGRVLRPLLIVENKKLNLDAYTVSEIRDMDIDMLVEKKIIEYLDVAEEKIAVVSYDSIITEFTTHMELDPAYLFNYVANIIPFINHNSASRASLGQKMLKQAATNYIPLKNIRPYARSYNTSYLQKPLVNTDIGFNLNQNIKNSNLGVNIVVAVAPIDGFNMEDAIVIKRESVERGLLFTEFKKAVTAEVLSTVDTYIKSFRIPDQNVSDLRESKYYDLLDEDGLISENTEVKNNYAIIGKINLPTFRKSTISKTNYIDASIFEKTNSLTFVNNVILTKTKQGLNTTSINLREPKFINIGDKLSSRYGQKGVVGIVKNEKDLPISESGIVPDLFISPHGFPSRLTFGHTLEMLYAKCAAIKGNFLTVNYGETPNIDLNILEKAGLKYTGDEIFYNPDTGKPIKVKIFTGISYYLRLEHIVDNKIYVRSTGPVQMLTRQPTEGKQKEGGLRLGEMERDALIAYGASNLVQERLNVDLIQSILCKNCHLPVEQNYKGKTICRNCKSDTFVKIKIPYAFKLLTDELNACNIKLEFKHKNVI